MLSQTTGPSADAMLRGDIEWLAEGSNWVCSPASCGSASPSRRPRYGAGRGFGSTLTRCLPCASVMRSESVKVCEEATSPAPTIWNRHDSVRLMLRRMRD